jgi:hypothetical protein
MHYGVKKLSVNESTSRIINFWNWTDHQPSKFMLSFYGHLGLAFEFMCRNPSLGLVTKIRACKGASQK